VNPNKTLKNVAVYVKAGVAAPPPVPADPVVVTQKECMYRPRVSGAMAGQAITIGSSDPTLHNVQAYRGDATLFNQAVPSPTSPPIQKTVEPGEPNLMTFKCGVHPWMKGYVVVSENPFIGVSGDDGKVVLKDVPAGKLALAAWHEKYGTKTVDVTVEPDKTATATIDYTGTETP
jgi:plastocyanin